MHGWQANKKRTCAQPVKFRVIPENEIPRVSTRGYLLITRSEPRKHFSEVCGVFLIGDGGVFREAGAGERLAAAAVLAALAVYAAIVYRAHRLARILQPVHLPFDRAAAAAF